MSIVPIGVGRDFWSRLLGRSDCTAGFSLHVKRGRNTPQQIRFEIPLEKYDLHMAENDDVRGDR
jgi:hypothetical protein